MRHRAGRASRQTCRRGARVRHRGPEARCRASPGSPSFTAGAHAPAPRARPRGRAMRSRRRAGSAINSMAVIVSSNRELVDDAWLPFAHPDRRGRSVQRRGCGSACPASPRAPARQREGGGPVETGGALSPLRTAAPRSGGGAHTMTRPWIHRSSGCPRHSSPTRRRQDVRPGAADPDGSGRTPIHRIGVLGS
ncbi:MAG: hypothetical protein QOJ85_3858 [Solirubrobacteraceae bacterium]|jgi:hypothetical protein|nr:hypothetical protein [Solirubrobacteraceae bacterium]MEA2240683.1 hypothetical protein [Solirubrobacteraceae bacterium]